MCGRGSHLHNKLAGQPPVGDQTSGQSTAGGLLRRYNVSWNGCLSSEPKLKASWDIRVITTTLELRMGSAARWRLVNPHRPLSEGLGLGRHSGSSYPISRACHFAGRSGHVDKTADLAGRTLV